MTRRDAGGALSVLMLDLDGFKAVNDTLGHETGDGLLVAFADVLRRSADSADVVARLGGDEFVIMLSRLDGGAETAVEVAERILSALHEPVSVGEHMLTIQASIGIAIAADDGTDSITEVLRRADLAMYTAKRCGLHDYAIYGQDPHNADRFDVDAVSGGVGARRATVGT